MKYSSTIDNIEYKDAILLKPGKTILIAKLTGGGLIANNEYIFNYFDEYDLLLSTIYVKNRKNFYNISRFKIPLDENNNMIEDKTSFDIYEIF